MSHGLTPQNYHDAENAAKWLSCSQIKAWSECESAAHARFVTGENEGPKSAALLEGSFLDVMLTGTPDEQEAFRTENADALFTRSGTPRANIARVLDMATRCRSDDRFMAAMTGDKQKIYVGEIAGQPVRIMTDCINEMAIWDLKKISRPDKLLWSPKHGKMVPFWQRWGYDWQAVIYQEIVRQNTNQDLPFVLAVVEAEAPHALKPFEMVDVYGETMPEIEATIERIAEIKAGAEPNKCGTCGWCKASTGFEVSEIVEF